MMRNFFIGLFALLTMVSCVDYNDIQFKEVKNIQIKNTGVENVLLDVTVDVENNARTFSLKEMSIEAVNGDKVYASVSLSDAVKVRKGENNDLLLPIRVKINGGFFGAAAIVLNAKRLKYNVSVKVKSCIISKRYKFDNLTASEVERVTGMNINNLLKR
ncbi:MAG: hypothetical protein RR277_05820 [Rikenellaceae bacterium]